MVGKPLRKIDNATQFSAGKNSSIELRAMYKDLDANEAMRQIENAIQVFNPNASLVDWLSNIIQRELSKFETVECQRLSLEVLGGLVEKEKVQEIIQTKLRMVMLGSLQHSFACLEDLQQKNNRDYLSKDDEGSLWSLEHNIRYVIEIVVKYQIKLDNLFSGLSVMSSEALLQKYYQLSLKVNKLENKFVPDYGCLAPMMPFLSWSNETEHSEKVEGIAEEVIEAHISTFEQQWTKAD